MNERGRTFEGAAAIMKLAPERVRELVAAENNRRELESFKRDSIPVHLTKSVIEEALARDPALWIGEIADWLDMRQADFERAFLGTVKGGQPKRHVHVSDAELADDCARTCAERAARMLTQYSVLAR